MLDAVTDGQRAASVMEGAGRGWHGAPERLVGPFRRHPSFGFTICPTVPATKTSGGAAVYWSVKRECQVPAERATPGTLNKQGSGSVLWINYSPHAELTACRFLERMAISSSNIWFDRRPRTRCVI